MQMNAPQKGFASRLAIVAGLVIGGLVLRLIADGLIASMETTADIGVFSWISMFSGLAFSLAAPVIAIVTLRYGRRHEAAIREHAGFSRLLTVYRILFWLAAICVLLAVAGVIWLGMHIGPVR